MVRCDLHYNGWQRWWQKKRECCGWVFLRWLYCCCCCCWLFVDLANKQQQTIGCETLTLLNVTIVCSTFHSVCMWWCINIQQWWCHGRRQSFCQFRDNHFHSHGGTDEFPTIEINTRVDVHFLTLYQRVWSADFNQPIDDLRCISKSISTWKRKRKRRRVIIQSVL